MSHVRPNPGKLPQGDRDDDAVPADDAAKLTQQWPPGFGLSIPTASWPEQAHIAQKKLSETITDLLNKHRETLDTQYRAGIRAIEDAFRVGEAKDPEQFRKLTEELWRQSYECLKNLVESQMRDIQTLMQKSFELASQGAATVKM